MTITTDDLDQRVFKCYKTARAAIKRDLCVNRPTRTVTAAQTRQMARDVVLEQMAEDVFESTGITLTHRLVKDITDQFQPATYTGKSI